MSTFAEEMAGHEDEWAAALERAGTGGMLPDGDYQAKIVESRVELTDWDEWQLYFKYEDLASGDTIRSWDSLQHEVGKDIAAARAKKLGYEGTAAGLEKACEDGEFIDLVCDIRVSTKHGETKDFKRVYINRCYGKVGGEGVPVGEPADDDDIPF